MRQLSQTHGEWQSFMSLIIVLLLLLLLFRTWHNSSACNILLLLLTLYYYYYYYFGHGIMRVVVTLLCNFYGVIYYYVRTKWFMFTQPCLYWVYILIWDLTFIDITSKPFISNCLYEFIWIFMRSIRPKSCTNICFIFYSCSTFMSVMSSSN